MKTIYKYQINQPGSSVVLMIPSGGEIVEIALKETIKAPEHPFVWVLFDAANVDDLVGVELQLFATGEVVPKDWYYQKTIHYSNGLVYHLFEYMP